MPDAVVAFLMSRLELRFYSYIDDKRACHARYRQCEESLNCRESCSRQAVQNPQEKAVSCRVVPEEHAPTILNTRAERPRQAYPLRPYLYYTNLLRLLCVSLRGIM